MQTTITIQPGIRYFIGGSDAGYCFVIRLLLVSWPDIMTLLEESMSLPAELGVKLDVEHSITWKSVLLRVCLSA